MLDIESAFYDVSEEDHCLEKSPEGKMADQEGGPSNSHQTGVKTMEIESPGIQDNSHSEVTVANRNGNKYKMQICFNNRRPVKMCKTDAKRCCIYVILTILLAGLISIIAMVLVYRFQEQYIHIVLPMGTIKGKYVSSPQGLEVEQYLGVPYAEPPVGELRYADPKPLDRFSSSVYEAFDYKYSCIQPLDTTFGDFPGSDMWNAKNEQREDCLYMNIWVPSKNKNKELAVMVWIYGGGFFSGSNSLWIYDGKALAAQGDVIVVSFNYRVGTFGYLSTGDGRIKGNFGMKDQVLALHWIQQHIYLFGGDPDKVTVFGESSGASSAGLLMMSDLSSHMFNRAIFESGSPDVHWAFMTNKQAKQRSSLFLSQVNCTQTLTSELLDCLRQLDSQNILSTEWVTSEFMVFPWAPSVDGDFLTDTPYNLLAQGKFADDKEVLLGVNRDEGTYWILYALAGLSKDGPSYQNYTMFKTGVDVIAWDLNQQQRDELINLYTTHEIVNISSLTRNRDALDKVCGDRSFTCPTLSLSDIYAAKSLKTYFYYLTYRASNQVWPPWMGVIHGAEIQWVFGMPMNDSKGYTDEEMNFSKTIMAYWSNFAKTGNPNGHGLPHWPQYTGSKPEHLLLNGPKNISTSTDLRQNFCTFWDKVNAHFNTNL